LANFGFPISTTQVITGSILGSGARRGFRGTRWGVAGQIAIAWVVTLPAAGLVGAALGEIGRAPAGLYILYLIIACGLGLLYAMRKSLFSDWEDHIEREEPIEETLVAEAKPTRRAKARA
jgi:inorganic phosphate transporter, PiT family